MVTTMTMGPGYQGPLLLEQHVLPKPAVAPGHAEGGKTTATWLRVPALPVFPCWQ